MNTFNSIAISGSILLLLSLTSIVTPLENQYFIASGGCYSLDEQCDGSLENPFGDLMTALLFVSEGCNSKPGENIITALGTVPSCSSSNTSEAYRELFDNCLSANYTIRGMSGQIKSIIKFCDKILLALVIKGGYIKFENICFEGNLGKIAISPYVKTTLKAFLNLKPEGDIILSIINCEFQGTLITSDQSSVFQSLISIENYLNTSIFVEISINYLITKNCSYQQGIIQSKAPQNNRKNCKIVILNSILTNYGNSEKVMHWMDGFRMKKDIDEYYDFAFILNNTLMILKNFSIINSSRIILANKFNELLIENIKIVIKDEITNPNKLPPELIYLIMLNNIKFTGLSILDSKIYSFDDNVEPNKRDLPFVNASLAPTSLLNFEKNQALFAFGIMNVGEFSEILINNSIMIKKENFGLTVFDLEYKNKLSIVNTTINFLVLDAESKIGFLSVFILAVSNDLYLNKGTFTDVSVYGYSNIMFGILNAGNKLNYSELKFHRTYFKTKSNRAEVISFMMALRTSPGLVFMSNAAELKTGGVYLAYVGNNIFLEEIYSEDLMCLNGCLVTLFYKNSLQMNKIAINQSTSDVISSFLSAAFANYVRGKNLQIQDCRGNSGAVYLFRGNDAIFEDSTFKSNWGTGGFNSLKYMEISGSIALVYENKMLLRKSSVILGNSDTLGGALYTSAQNYLEIDESVFLTNNAPIGGALQSKILNTIKIMNSKFIDNYGRLGEQCMGMKITLSIS